VRSTLDNEVREACMDNSGSTCTFGTMATLVVRGGGMVVWSRRTIKGEVEVMRS
jgi:hypothetical protein